MSSTGSAIGNAWGPELAADCRGVDHQRVLDLVGGLAAWGSTRPQPAGA
jgi:hypothetical protein